MNDDLINVFEKKILTNELDAFIKLELTKQSPIIENIPNDENNNLVTFIYEGNDASSTIGLYSSLIGNLPQQMTRLKNTNYFYYSLVVPNNIRASYAFLPNMEFHSDDIKDREKSLKLFSEMWPKLLSDPYNSKKQILQTGESRSTITVSILEMPYAPSNNWGDKKVLTPKGSVTKHSIVSDLLKESRDYWIYLPNQYNKNISYPLLIVFDGQLYFKSGIPLPTILDNLINEHKIPPVIAVLVDSVGFITRRIDLCCSENYLEFITNELLREINSKYSVSNNSSDRVVIGASLGGIFSLYSSLRRPDLFGKVLSNSGGTNPIINQLIKTNQSSKLKVYLDIGLLENSNDTKQARDLLQANGHEVIYQEFPGTHDLVCWETTIPSALIQLLK